MTRGLISGMIWGFVVSAVVLAMASLMGEQPPGNAPPEPPQVSAPEQAPAEANNGGTSADPATPPDQPAMPAVPDAQSPLGGAASPDADTSPPPAPETGETPDSPSAPGGGEAAPDAPSAGGDAAPEGTDGAALPAQPEAEGNVQIATGPSQPTPPEEPEVPQVVEEAPEPIEEGPESAPEQAQDPAPEPETATEPEQLATPEPPAEPEPVTEPDPATEPEVEVTQATGDAPSEDPVEQPAPETPEVDQPRIALQGEDGPSLPGGNGGIVIRRPEADAASEADDGTAEGAVPGNSTPLESFAAAVQNPEGKPIVGLVLIDSGNLPEAVALTRSLPFPVTVALDPTMANAAETARAYRDAGIEIAALPRLPAGAGAGDVETTLEVTFAAIPEAVALVDDGAGGWQGSRDVTGQTMARLSDEGRGFLTAARGLGGGLRAAEDQGVPAGAIYRDLDPDGQESQVIRRFIDQAAFRARQEEGVILLGRLRPDTISALTLWGTANRDGPVMIGPLSAVLLAGAEE